VSTIDPRVITTAAQDAAKALMTDTCRIERVGEVITTDDGVDTPTITAVYEGVCRAKPLVSRSEGPGDTGPAPTGDFQYTLSLPITATGVEFGDRVTMTDSWDPSLPGVVMQIRSAERGSQISARRMRCVEVSR
jgi:hypothetical protein